MPYNLRCYITRFRIAAHSLRIVTGRFGPNRIPHSERYCQCCENRDIEDVYHFVCICPLYSELRKRYINEKYYKPPSMYTFISLIESRDNHKLTNLARYIKLGLDTRSKVHNIFSTN